jgi:hypothetical protein
MITTLKASGKAERHKQYADHPSVLQRVTTNNPEALKLRTKQQSAVYHALTSAHLSAHTAGMRTKSHLKLFFHVL